MNETKRYPVLELQEHLARLSDVFARRFKCETRMETMHEGYPVTLVFGTRKQSGRMNVGLFVENHLYSVLPIEEVDPVLATRLAKELPGFYVMCAQKDQQLVMDTEKALAVTREMLDTPSPGVTFSNITIGPCEGDENYPNSIKWKPVSTRFTLQADSVVLEEVEGVTRTTINVKEGTYLAEEYPNPPYLEGAVSDVEIKEVHDATTSLLTRCFEVWQVDLHGHKSFRSRSLPIPFTPVLSPEQHAGIGAGGGDEEPVIRLTLTFNGDTPDVVQAPFRAGERPRMVPRRVEEEPLPLPISGDVDFRIADNAPASSPEPITTDDDHDDPDGFNLIAAIAREIQLVAADDTDLDLEHTPYMDAAEAVIELMRRGEGEPENLEARGYPPEFIKAAVSAELDNPDDKVFVSGILGLKHGVAMMFDVEAVDGPPLESYGATLDSLKRTLVEALGGELIDLEIFDRTIPDLPVRCRSVQHLAKRRMEELKQLNANMTATHVRCTALIEEMRQLRKDLQPLNPDERFDATWTLASDNPQAQMRRAIQGILEQGDKGDYIQAAARLGGLQTWCAAQIKRVVNNAKDPLPPILQPTYEGDLEDE